jgi:DNA-binding response OmpR family regulator
VRLPDQDGPSEPSSSRASTYRVLLVEDDAALRALFVRLLEEDGAEVVDVGDARTALDRIYTTVRPFDLLVTDNSMPGMSGATLARQVQRVWSTLPILCVTGRPPTAEEGRLRAAGSAPVRWLLKPVTPAEFLEAVRSLARR